MLPVDATESSDSDFFPGCLAGVVSLLQDCGAALAPSVRLLLRILFTLAQDGWPQVAQPCMAYLRSANPASTSGR